MDKSFMTGSYAAHLFKALTKQHHRDMVPLFKKYLPKDGVVFDVGAHAGQFTKLFSKLVPQGRVYAFEPGGYPLSILRKVIAVHRLRNVAVFACGLSDKAGTSELHMPIKKSGSMGFGLSHMGAAGTGAVRTESVALSTIDDFVKRHGVTRLDFIKADIEGWEMRMLAGGVRTLQTLRPVLMLEASDAYLARAGDTVQSMADFIAGVGYDVLNLGTGAPLKPQAGMATDILCVPKKIINTAQ